MKRYAALVILTVLCVVGNLSFVEARNDTTSNWTALNAALAPVNVQLADDVQALNLAVADAGAATQSVFFTSVFNADAMDESIGALRTAMGRIAKYEKAVKADALAGIDVLDSFAIEDCSAHFWALSYTMFSSWAETITELQAREPTAAAGAAFWLGGFSGVDGTRLPAGGPIDAEWSRTKCAGARPSPGPSVAPSPSGSAAP